MSDALRDEAAFARGIGEHLPAILGERSIGSAWLADPEFWKAFKEVSSVIGNLIGDRLDALADKPAAPGMVSVSREALEEAERAIHGAGAWRCRGCGEFMARERSHGRADHAPDCDGSCKKCPVEVECGPIEDVTDDVLARLRAAAGDGKRARLEG